MILLRLPWATGRPGRHVRLSACRRCGATILLASDAEGVGQTVRADLLGLDVAGELQRRMNGEETWDLIPLASGHCILIYRDVTRMTAARRTGLVVGDHRCRHPPVTPAEHPANDIVASLPIDPPF